VVSQPSFKDSQAAATADCIFKHHQKTVPQHPLCTSADDSSLAGEVSPVGHCSNQHLRQSAHTVSWPQVIVDPLHSVCVGHPGSAAVTERRRPAERVRAGAPRQYHTTQ